MSDTLNKQQIKDLLPHREPMLLIDELINIRKLKSATAIVNVTKDSFFVQGHFPGEPVNTSATKNGCERNLCIFLALATVNLSSSESSSIPRMAMMS